jgi:hypothetical protein
LSIDRTVLRTKHNRFDRRQAAGLVSFPWKTGLEGGVYRNDLKETDLIKPWGPCMDLVTALAASTRK